MTCVKEALAAGIGLASAGDVRATVASIAFPADMTNLHPAAFDSAEYRAKQWEIENGLGERQEQAVGAIG